jgi:drug/metabolite transporter (DMT)-like permease
VIFGLSAALGWGLADFGGAVAGRRIGSISTVIVGQVLSFLFMTTLLVATGEPVSELEPILGWVALNGLFTAVAYVTHYRALELGPVAVVSPIGATYAVVGVALAIVVLGERPGPLQLTGAMITVVGVMLVSTDLRKLRAGTHGVPPGLPWAIVSAVGFGVAAFLLGYASKEAGWIAGLWASRMAQVAFYVPVAIAFRRQLGRLRPGFGLWVALGAGAADILGVTTFSAGAERGFLSIVLAASAVFPMIAVLLSIRYLHERLVPNQFAGIAFVVAGLLLLGLG